LVPDWDAYHLDLINDDPVEDMVVMVNALHFGGLFVHGFTARPEKWRAPTQAWLTKHRVHFDGLIMRPDTDFRPSAECKVAMAVSHFGSEQMVRDHVALIVDDREDVLTAFAGLGVTTLLINARR
jgi:hypothetical protein